MVRRLLLLVLLVALLAAGVGAVVLSGRAPVRDAHREVDAAWTPLQAPLGARYAALGQLPTALAAAGVGSRESVVELRSALERWTAGADDPASGAAAANDLEGLAARLRADVAASPRLTADPGVTAAFAAFDSAVVPAGPVDAFDAAVRRYQAVRTALLKRPAALAFGFDAVPVLVID